MRVCTRYISSTRGKYTRGRPLTWHACLYTLHQGLSSNVHPQMVEFMCRVFTRMPGERYRRRLRSLCLYLCYVFRGLINSLVRVMQPLNVCVCQTVVTRPKLAPWGGVTLNVKGTSPPLSSWSYEIFTVFKPGVGAYYCPVNRTWSLQDVSNIPWLE